MIHDQPIYHCQCCGAVVTQERYRLPPFCCGHEMIKAAEQTLQGDLPYELDLEPSMLEPRLAPHWTAPEREHVSVST